MTDTKQLQRAGPIEVWLTQKNIGITCTVVREDESTQDLDVESLSMRGAQREMSGWLVANGYTPAGRWETESDNADDPRSRYEATECMRRFKPGSDATYI